MREPFCLSRRGSTRATAYEFSNHVVTLEGRTHVVWLDAVSTVRARTFDHGSGRWSDPVTVDEGADNHTSPALVADVTGRLHLCYGPHGWWADWNQGRFRHLVSTSPHDITDWTDRSDVGYNATYPCLVSTPEGLDAIVYRGGEDPRSVMFQQQRIRGGWSSARELMRQDIFPQYTHVGAHLASHTDGTLYVGAHFYNMKIDAASHGVCVLKSSDFGRTWTGLRTREAELPIERTDRYAVPHEVDADVRLVGMAVSADGALHVSTTSRKADYGQVARWSGKAWEVTPIKPFVPSDRIAQAGPITFDTGGRLHMAATMSRQCNNAFEWHHGTNKVFHLVSGDGGRTFGCRQVSPGDDDQSNWLASLSLSGIHHPVGHPTILYTRGPAGQGCRPADETEVWCVFVET